LQTIAVGEKRKHLAVPYEDEKGISERGETGLPIANSIRTGIVI
jgi:hypothetical protein